MPTTLHTAIRGVGRLLTIALVGVVGSTAARAQNINVRAQAHYYSAREAFQGGQFDRALGYVYRSKEALGGTNRQLQYIHIMAAYNARKFAEAQRELETFFDITEKKVTEARFDRSVEPLTDDEVTALTKLVNKIDEAVAAENAEAAAAKAARDARRRAAAQWVGTYTGKRPTGEQGVFEPYTFTVSADADGRITATFRFVSLYYGGEFEEELSGYVGSDDRLYLQGTAFRTISGTLRHRRPLGSIEADLISGAVIATLVVPGDPDKFVFQATKQN